MQTPALVLRSRFASRRRGRTAAKVLLVLSALFLVVGVIGAFVARNAFTNELMPTFMKIGERVKASAAEGVITVPGEKTITLSEPGGIAFGAFEKTEVDGKTYTFAPAGQLDVTVVDASGNDVKVEKPQGMQPIDMKENGTLHVIGFASIEKAGTYTVKTQGQDTAIYGLTISTAELTGMQSAAVKLIGGAAGGCCGIPLFLLFGIIGGILLIFGKKPTPMP